MSTTLVLSLVLKVLDMAAMGYAHYLRAKPAIDTLRAKIKHWLDTGTEPTEQDFAELNASIDADLQWLNEHKSEVQS